MRTRTELGSAGVKLDGVVLLTGASGQVGGELLKLLPELAEVVAPVRAEMDLADESAVRRVIREVRPRWIVNPGAYTAVDKAESEPELAQAINCDAVKAMGEEAWRLGAAVIQFSTDYVFDGEGSRAYVESNPTGPRSVYGVSKLAGECALAASGAAHLIFRTSWVFGSTGRNFLRTILKLAREREQLQVVADQHGAPTWSRDLAKMTVSVMRGCEHDAAGGSLAAIVRERGGTFHAAGSGQTTWHGFALQAIGEMAAQKPGGRWARVEAVSTAEFPTAARRPANSRLDCRRLEAVLGWKMMDWRESVKRVIEEIEWKL